MESRIALLREFDLNIFTVSELCRRHAISRETFYYWKRRRDDGDAHWFAERSHAPLNCPHAMADETAQAVLSLRKRFRHFGPKKLHARVLMDYPGLIAPSPSSIGALLKREGMIESTLRRSAAKEQGEIVGVASAPCDEWAIDFKGWFRTLDGARCDPLTVSDTASRYLLAVQIIPPRLDETQAVLKRLFQTYGLPKALRSDNGSPFGSRGAGGLSQLSVWLMRQNVEPHYIPPGCPQHNSRHERMHRTLKAETSKPPAANPRVQQGRFTAFQRRYNIERPHEALGQTVPARHWQASPRPYQTNPAEPWYDADHHIRRVRSDGTIRWQGELVFISEVLHGQLIGLAEQDNGLFLTRFMHRELGVVQRDQRFQAFAPPRARFTREHANGHSNCS